MLCERCTPATICLVTLKCLATTTRISLSRGVGLSLSSANLMISSRCRVTMSCNSAMVSCWCSTRSARNLMRFSLSGSGGLIAPSLTSRALRSAFICSMILILPLLLYCRTRDADGLSELAIHDWLVDVDAAQEFLPGFRAGLVPSAHERPHLLLCGFGIVQRVVRELDDLGA